MWTIAAAASASVVSQQDLYTAIADLTPVVAAEAGRTFDSPVGGEVVTRAELAEVLARPPVALGDAGAPPVPRALDERDQQILTTGVAVYIQQEQSIYLIDDAVDELVDLVPSGEVKGVVRCVVAHELVHALQHRYTDIPDESEDARRGRIAYEEGHASLVGLAVCEKEEGPRTAAMARQIQGFDAAVLGDLDNQGLPYAVGRYLSERVLVLGRDRMWASLAAPAPPWSALVADVRPILAGGWEDVRPVTDAMQALRIPGSPVPATAHPLWDMLGLVAEVEPISTGWWVHEGGDTLGVFRMSDGIPSNLVDLRARDFVNTVEAALMTRESWVVTSVRTSRRSRDDRVSDVLRIAVHGTKGRWYHEEWLARGTVLVVRATERKPEKLKDEELALGTLLRAMPTDAPSDDLPALAGWVARVMEEPPPTRPGADWRMLQATTAWRNGDADACAAAFEDVLADGEHAGGALWVAAHRCAVITRELETADRAARGLLDLAPDAAGAHAWMLLEARREADALRVLDRARAKDDTAVLDARMAALAALRRWDELAATAQKGGSPEVLVQAGDTLVQAGKVALGKRILAGACPKVTPKPEACP